MHYCSLQYLTLVLQGKFKDASKQQVESFMGQLVERSPGLTRLDAVSGWWLCTSTVRLTHIHALQCNNNLGKDDKLLGFVVYLPRFKTLAELFLVSELAVGG